MNATPDGDTDEKARERGDREPLLVVGLGASAGGIKALQKFFAHIPPDSGCAYVVVLHLSPDHESRLAEVLQAATPLPVRRVSATLPLERDHVYVISPRTSLRMNDGLLTVSESLRPEERRTPVDIFLRTLADAHRDRAVGIVLSGTGSDGSSGIRILKEHGGLTMAQEPSEAEHQDMPRNAIATTLVDYVLPVAEMPARILKYGTAALTAEGRDEEETAQDLLREILSILRVRAGHDFSQYKTATVLRRVERRRHIHGLPDLGAYAQLLRDEAAEAAALLKELLISVTHFFRDPEAFAVLEQKIVPRLFEQRRPEAHMVRAWVAGCATGEEAYSIGVLLAEAAERSADPPIVQVFATDLDAHAITIAREGRYTDIEVADVPAERLRRFFTRDGVGYRVRRELRETVLFAHHNLLTDPPFSHIDLICCRNVLIYLKRGAQQRVLETFHFAMRPGAFLFLGSSESIEGSRELYAVVDREARIFEGRLGTATPDWIPREPIVSPAVAAGRTADLLTARRDDERVLPAQLHLKILEHYAPPSIVVSEEHQIVHVSQHAGRYLHVPGGEPSRSLLDLVRPELRGQLRAALFRAARERTNVVVDTLHLRMNGMDAAVRMEVRPVLGEGDPARGFLLVLFNEDVVSRHHPESDAVRTGTDEDSDPARHLEAELARLKAQLQATVEQYETQVEEARASNEELQAVNEELRSSAEELETSKEELQSVNEELTTVNQELKIKVDELAATNNDFQNLLNSTEIATIFLDRAQRVKLITPRVREVFNLLPLDTGRSLSDITTSLLYDRLEQDIRMVLGTLQTLEREVRTVAGRWFVMRVLPYRTIDERIGGTVLTFQDITARREAEEAVRASEERLRLLIDSVHDYAIFTITLEGMVDSWNTGASRMFRFDAEEIIGKPVGLLFTPEDRAAGVPQMELERARTHGKVDDERWHVRKDGTRLYCSGVTTRIGSGHAKGFAKIARDLTERRDAQSALERATMDMERRVLERTGELQTEMLERQAAEQRAVELVRKLVSTQEDERARVARDIHDSVGQQLTALRLSLERLQEACRPDTEAVEEVGRALTFARDMDRELDFLAWELRPAALDDLGLAAALSRYLKAWSDHLGIPAEFRSAGLGDGRMGRETETTFYRVAQEALNNVAKHAHATRVDIIVEQRDDSLVLVVEDDGVGFDPADFTASASFGLVGMRERAALIGATLQIESAPGVGTTIFLRQPAARGHK